MEVKEVKFKKYIPSEGKALKVIQKNTVGNTHVLSYSSSSIIVDENDLVCPIEEVDFQEFEKWWKENRGHCGLRSLY